jgi:hypothetical protein
MRSTRGHIVCTLATQRLATICSDTIQASRVHGRAYREFDLTQYPVGTELTFTFSYWLDTENPAGRSQTVNFDRVRVNIAADASFPIGSGHRDSDCEPHWRFLSSGLESLANGGRLQSTFGGWAGQVVYIGFEFDSMDAIYNNFEGFYIDDVTLRVRQVRLADRKT